MCGVDQVFLQALILSSASCSSLVSTSCSRTQNCLDLLQQHWFDLPLCRPKLAAGSLQGKAPPKSRTCQCGGLESRCLPGWTRGLCNCSMAGSRMLCSAPNPSLLYIYIYIFSIWHTPAAAHDPQTCASSLDANRAASDLSPKP